MLAARLVLLTALALAAAACAPPRPPLTSPANGGPPWTEIVSEHVVLKTDVAPDEARRRVAQFEAMHDTVVAAMGIPAPARAARVEVVLFERSADFFEVAGKTKTQDAYFMPRAPGDLEPHPVMVMHEQELEEITRDSFQHELAHRLLHTRYPSLPRWIDEGLAQYFARVDARPEGILVGDPGKIDFWPRPYAAYTWLGNLHQLNLPMHRAPALAELVAANAEVFYAATARGEDVSDEDRLRQGANYAAAWRLVHYLLDEAPAEDRARFTAALDAMAKGERDAFAARFGAEMPRLQAAFTDYLTRSARRSWLRKAVPARPDDARARPLSDVDVHLLWSRLFRASDDRAGGEAAAAIAADPRAPEPHFQRAVVLIESKRYDAARAELGTALAEKPDEPRYLYGKLVLLERSRQPVPAALVEALARDAVSASQLEAAARYVGRRRLADGLLLVARAVAADPLCWRCQVTRAALLARGGARDDALVALDRAVALTPEGVTQEVVAFRRRLAAAAAPASDEASAE